MDESERPMNDDELEEPLRTMAKDYRAAPAPDREAMWAAIQAQRARAGGPARVLRFPRWTLPLGMAALLALAFGLGRWSREPAPPVPVTTNTPAPTAPTGEVRSPGLVHQVAAEEYFGRMEVFLTDLPRSADTKEQKEEVADQARRLLATTRLLLDTRTGDDARLRPLLEDLELALAGIARLPAEPAGDLGLITQGLDRRGTLALLRSQVKAGTPPAPSQGEL